MLKVLTTGLLCFNLSVAHALVLEALVEKGELTSTLSHKKVGYYVGSFDPLHLGHENLAKQVLENKLCDYVLIYPAWGGDEYKNRTDVAIRLEMLFATFANHPQIIVTKLPPGALQNVLMKPSTALIANKPSVETNIPGTQYIGMIGSDTAIDTSKDPKKLSVFMKGIQVSDKYSAHTIGGIIAIPVQGFIVSLRTGDSIKHLNGKLGDCTLTEIMQTNYMDFSSTKTRQAIKAELNIDHLVNPKVKNIITTYKLYKE